MSLRFAGLSMACFLALMPLGASAADKVAPPPSSPPASQSAAPEKETPLDALRLYTFDLIEGMSEKQLHYIYVIRTRHGIVRAVELVRRDVGKAVGLCSKAHPDLKTPLESRFTRWKDTVGPILEDAQNVLERDIVNQDFVKKDKIRKLLDMTQKAAEYTDAQVVKEIVTTPEACDFLLKNMDITQRDLPELLNASLRDLRVPDPDDASAPDKSSSTPATPKEPPAEPMKKDKPAAP